MTSTPGQAHIERDRKNSTPWWPAKKNKAAGKPNVVILYMDDMGFADIGCFGSEIATPHIDGLARQGVRFNHYTTHPVCSAARAALFTGRNAHAVGTGWLAHNNSGFPGYTGEIPAQAQTMAEAFAASDYLTLLVGKWHNSVDSQVPNATWPCQRGFKRFYGFMEGETSYFHPARLVNDNTVIDMDAYPPGYYSTDDWTTKAIEMILDGRNHAPATPFFLQLSFNAVHGPMQAKQEDIAKYAGRYDVGWDVIRQQRFERQKELGVIPQDAALAPRDPRVPAWDSLPMETQKFYARFMEVYAAMLDSVDQNIGRLLQALHDCGQLDNTIVLFSSDNGGTGAGGPSGNVNHNRYYAGLAPQSFEHNLAKMDELGSAKSGALYPTGWAQASNVPFPSYKTYTGGGGRRVSFILRAPNRHKVTGAVLPQAIHVTDLFPTLAELCGVPLLESLHGEPTLPVHGISFAELLRSPELPAKRMEQYYECWANRAFYRDGWVAVSLQKRGEEIDFDNWTLHYQGSDFSETVDLASEHPAKLLELVEAFDQAAKSYAVYPLDNRSTIQKFNQTPPGDKLPSGTRLRFFAGTQTIHRKRVAPLVSDRSYQFTVQMRYEPGDQGVLFALGDTFGGLVLYIKDGSLCLSYNGFGERSLLRQPLSVQGDCALTLDFQALGERRGQCWIGPRGVTERTYQALSPTLLWGFHEGMDIGIDRRGPVDWNVFEEHGNFPYSNQIQWLEVELGALAPDHGI